jgi:Cu/Ag efflux protein CusF
MLKFLSTFAALLLASGALFADVTGKVTSVDTDKSSVIVSVDGKDQTLTVDKSATIQVMGKKKMLTDVAGGLGGLKTGDQVTATVETKDGKSVVTKIVVAGGKKKKTQ